MFLNQNQSTPTILSFDRTPFGRCVSVELWWLFLTLLQILHFYDIYVLSFLGSLIYICVLILIKWRIRKTYIGWYSLEVRVLHLQFYIYFVKVLQLDNNWYDLVECLAFISIFFHTNGTFQAVVLAKQTKAR